MYSGYESKAGIHDIFRTGKKDKSSGAGQVEFTLTLADIQGSLKSTNATVTAASVVVTIVVEKYEHEHYPQKRPMRPIQKNQTTEHMKNKKTRGTDSRVLQ